MGHSYTVAERIDQYGAQSRARLANAFKAAGIAYPPKQLTILAIKQTNVLHIYATGNEGPRHIKTYPILAASGELGPKLLQGDNQVPEGIYRVELLNPNSMFHLSLRLNYPNEFDRAQAKKDSRLNLGGDIMIHGNQVSIGCIAIGDRAIEELFVLASDTGLRHIKVIVSPIDFRKKNPPLKLLPKTPAWLTSLYDTIRRQMTEETPLP